MLAAKEAAADEATGHRLALDAEQQHGERRLAQARLRLGLGLDCLTLALALALALALTLTLTLTLTAGAVPPARAARA